MTQIIETLADISDRYDAAFVDLWGCLHNGMTAFPEAVAALQAFRDSGGTVVLLTNAPRQRSEVEKHLVRLNVPDSCWDTITTSGDSARLAMFNGAVGQRVYFIGQKHDLAFFDPMQIVDNPTEITQVPLKDADGIVCCGPFDPLADPDDMRPDLLYAKANGLKLLCANPDIVVDRGEQREWCAGKLAEVYTEMGGESLYFGKPHPPIYDLARRRLAAVRQGVLDERIICIGDGVLTDVLGAMGEDLDCIFITGGLARAETGTDRQPQADKLDAYLAKAQMTSRYAMGFLR